MPARVLSTLLALLLPLAAARCQTPPAFEFLKRFEKPELPLSAPAGNTALLLTLGGIGSWQAFASGDPFHWSTLIQRSAHGLGQVGNVYGDGLSMLALAGGLQAAGRALDEPRHREASRELLGSFLVSGITVQVLKRIVRRRRPDGGPFSFPSGHTATAFSALPVIRKHYGPLAGAAAGLLALSTAHGRMQDRRHYLSDVIFGAAIGLSAGQWVSGSSAWLPGRLSLGVDGRGLGLRWRF